MKKQNNTTPKLYTKKIKNWSEYNRALIRRGNISVYISEAIAKKAFLKPKKNHRVGHPFIYQDSLIELILTIRELFHLPLRQTSGFVMGLLQGMGLNWSLPDYSTLSRRMGSLNVDFCRQLRGKGVCGRDIDQDIVLLLDSSGFKVFGEGEWKVRKHGYTYRRTWRKVHIAVDFTSRHIIGLINTKADVHDNTQLKPLLKQAKHNIHNGTQGSTQGSTRDSTQNNVQNNIHNNSHSKPNRYPNNSPRSNSHDNPCNKSHGNPHDNQHHISTIIGDGAYDSKDNYLLARQEQLELITPPPKNATEHLNFRPKRYEVYDTPGWEERNAVIRHAQEYGLDGWKADTEYHRRSLVENAFYRLKTIFGGNLKSRTDENQYTEQCIRASLINRFNELGLPKYGEYELVVR